MAVEALLVTVLLLVGVLVGPLPSWAPGADAQTGPTRYRDEVFTDLTVDRDLVYGQAAKADGTQVQLLADVYRPAGDTATARPAVIWVHGGGFAFGNKTDGIQVFAEAYARRGYVTVSIDYRLLNGGGCTGGGGIPPQCVAAALDAIHDSQAAVRWLRANADRFGVDPGRIAVGGTSAGAIAATGVATLAASPGEGGHPEYSSAISGFVSIAGGLPSGFVGADAAPGLLFSGSSDPTVPHAWSVDTTADLRAHGIAAELVTWEGGDHEAFRSHLDEVYDRTTDFLYRVLVDGPRVGVTPPPAPPPPTMAPPTRPAVPATPTPGHPTYTG